MMAHQAYLSLGSNIEPEIHLRKAIDLLKSQGEILRLSEAWETEAVGSKGPNYLNACCLFSTPLLLDPLRDQILHPIEGTLGRHRTEDKFAPRTIDIDIILFDGRSCDDRFWELAYVVVPLAEIHPQFQNPLTKEPIPETATRLHQQVWIEARPEVLRQYKQGRVHF